MPPSSKSFDPEMRERLRRRLLQRGSILATLLAEVLSGKDKSSALQALGSLRPGIRPEEALRKALDQIEHRRLLLVSNDDRYGCCEICGIDLGAAALEEMPWADRCPAHAAS
jgi:RNA polymerase-binding transcription factor DksA